MALLRRWAADLVPEIDLGQDDEGVVQQFEDLLALRREKNVNAREVIHSVGPMRARLFSMRQDADENAALIELATHALNGGP